MESPISQPELVISDPKPTNKRRRKKSIVWDHFTTVTISANCIRASCNQCKKLFAYISGDKPSGTSHLLRHIALGICPEGRKEKNQPIPCPSTPRTDISANRSNLQRKRCRAANGVSHVRRTTNNRNHNNNNNFGHELAKMIIHHDYPLNMVEQTGFLSFARSLNPQYNITSVGPVQDEIMGIFKRDKQRIKDLLSRIPGRINLTLDFWTSNQGLDYLLLTGHFTDHNWKLQRRVLSFSLVQSFSNSDTACNRAIAFCLSDWSLEGKIFTVTLDRGYYANRESLRNVLSIENSEFLKGQLLINGCYGCLLRSLARDGIGSMQQTVDKVRHSVKYIKTSDSHEERFNKLKQLLQVPSTKELIIDDLMRWDTTYLMLTAACEVKQVFSCLDTSDPDYKSTPSMEEWRQVETLCSFLKIFYEAACKLTSDSYPTANLFFGEVSDIHLELMHAAWSHDLLVSALVKPLHEKFSEFWDDNYLILAIAAMLDPRFKAELVESKFSCIYGKDAQEWTVVCGSLSELFGAYEENPVKTDILLPEGDDLLNFDLDISEIMGEPHAKSEMDDGFLETTVFQPNLEDSVFHVKLETDLDRYLDDPVLPYLHEFDTMGWWKMYGVKYPVLLRLACDLLSVPFCTVPLECIFETGGRRVDSHQSSLCPTTLEALVCAKDWLQYDEVTGSSVLSET